MKSLLALLVLSSSAALAAEFPACPADYVEYKDVHFVHGHPAMLFMTELGADDHHYITVILVNQKDKSQNGTWTTPDHGGHWWRLSGCWQGDPGEKS